MTTIEVGRWPRTTPASAVAIVLATAMLAVAVGTGQAVGPATALLIVVTAVAAGLRIGLSWERLVALTIAIVLFIPIKRYELVVSLPFDLEPYRIVLAAVLALWFAALLSDDTTRLRRTPLDAPLGLFLFAVGASVVTNLEGIVHFDVVHSLVGTGTGYQFLLPESGLVFVDVSSEVVKQTLFLVAFVLAFYFIVSVVRTPQQIESVLKVLVVGGSIVAAFAIVERRTRYNVFDHLQGVVPGLTFEDVLSGNVRSGDLRVLGSAQHPIALAALFVMLVPLSLYLLHRMRRWWWVLTTAILGIAPFATVSRTAIVMGFVGVIVFWVLRPAEVRRALPLLLPLLVAVHFLAPGAIGGLQGAFFPSSGLVEDQTQFGGRISSRRLKPQFDVIRAQPMFGEGYGTRITAGPLRNSRILDNQWLGTTVETGLLGAGAWIWLFVRFVRRAGRAAREDDSPRGWLMTALAASIAGFAVGMLTYDTFSFIQVTFVGYVLLALGCSTVQWSGKWPPVADSR